MKTSWTAINTGLTNLQSYCFAMSGSNMFLGTWGAGVWKRPIIEMVTNIEEKKYQNDFTISPNPGNGKFFITSAQMQKPANISVFNISGQKIMELNNANQFDLSDAPKGVYFAKISDDKKITVKKIVLN